MSANRVPLVSVIGASECGEELERQAHLAGRLLAEHGLGIVCGGRTGVMEAVCRGAVEAGGWTVGLLPGRVAQEANRYVRIAIPTGLGEMRNALVVRAGEAVLALGGGFGTLSEIAFALKWGKPVFGVDTWMPVDGSGMHAPVRSCTTVEEAVAGINETIAGHATAGG